MLVIQAFRKQKQENQKFAIILSYIVTLKLTWAIYVRHMLSLSVHRSPFSDVETDTERPFTYMRLESGPTVHDPNHCAFLLCLYEES